MLSENEVKTIEVMTLKRARGRAEKETKRKTNKINGVIGDRQEQSSITSLNTAIYNSCGNL